jgi:hypothetical protein
MPNLHPRGLHAEPDTNCRSHPDADTANGVAVSKRDANAGSNSNVDTNSHRDSHCDVNFHAYRHRDGDAYRDAYRVWAGVIQRCLFAKICGYNVRRKT